MQAIPGQSQSKQTFARKRSHIYEISLTSHQKRKNLSRNYMPSFNRTTTDPRAWCSIGCAKGFTHCNLQMWGRTQIGGLFGLNRRTLGFSGSLGIRRMWALALGLLGMATLARAGTPTLPNIPMGPGTTFNVTSYGAVGDGVSDNTAAI